MRFRITNDLSNTKEFNITIGNSDSCMWIEGLNGLLVHMLLNKPDVLKPIKLNKPLIIDISISEDQEDR